jgi:hypothetical protein
MSSWLDLLPSHERQKLRERRKLSAAEYEKLREKVKSVEKIGEEMAENERIAELKFAIESEPKIKEALRAQIEADLKEEGLENVLDAGAPEALRKALQEGKFDVQMGSDPDTHRDQLVIVPEGTVAERLVVPPVLSDRYVTQFVQAVHEEA